MHDITSKPLPKRRVYGHRNFGSKVQADSISVKEFFKSGCRRPIVELPEKIEYKYLPPVRD